MNGQLITCIIKVTEFCNKYFSAKTRPRISNGNGIGLKDINTYYWGERSNFKVNEPKG